MRIDFQHRQGMMRHIGIDDAVCFHLGVVSHAAQKPETLAINAAAQR